MKKSIIAAGAASVALAAMPVVGAFAASTTTTTQVDTLIINITAVCQFGYNDDPGGTPTIDVTDMSHAPGSGTWGNNSSANPGDLDHPDTLSKTMLTGTQTQDLGSTRLGVYCNNENGYKITASGAGALTDTTTTPAVTDNIPVNSNFYDTSGTVPVITTGWSYKVAADPASGVSQRGVVLNGHTDWADNGTDTSGGTTATSPVANQIIAGSPSSAPKTTTNDGDYFKITYGVGIDDTQSAGTYKGSITYTLAQL